MPFSVVHYCCKPSNAWDNLEDSDAQVINCWNDFLQSPQAHQYVLDWNVEFHNMSSFISDDSEADYVETCESVETEKWMFLAELINTNYNAADTNFQEIPVDYWESMRNEYTLEQIDNMPSWLENQKKIFIVDATLNHKMITIMLNKEQKLACDI